MIVSETHFDHLGVRVVDLFWQTRELSNITIFLSLEQIESFLKIVGRVSGNQNKQSCTYREYVSSGCVRWVCLEEFWGEVEWSAHECLVIGQ